MLWVKNNGAAKPFASGGKFQKPVALVTLNNHRRTPILTMDSSLRMTRLFALISLAAGLALTGCKSNEAKPTETTSQAEPAAKPADQPAAQPAAQPAPAPAAQQKPVCKDEPAKTTANKKKDKSGKPAQKNAQMEDCVPASAAAPAAAAAPVAQAASASGTYDLSKNKPVTNSAKVEAGQGTLVKGVNDWEGEITGVPAAGSKFAKLKIGMLREDVFNQIGYPTYQGAYATGKAWIPFYHGSDRVRWEAIYNGQGRLIFSQQGGWGGSSQFYLTWIIHSANEGR